MSAQPKATVGATCPSTPSRSATFDQGTLPGPRLGMSQCSAPTAAPWLVASLGPFPAPATTKAAENRQPSAKPTHRIMLAPIFRLCTGDGMPCAGASLSSACAPCRCCDRLASSACRLKIWRRDSQDGPLARGSCAGLEPAVFIPHPALLATTRNPYTPLLNTDAMRGLVCPCLPHQAHPLPRVSVPPATKLGLPPPGTARPAAWGRGTRRPRQTPAAG